MLFGIRTCISVQLHQVRLLLVDGAVLLQELALDFADLGADLTKVLHDGEDLLARRVKLVLELLDGARSGLFGLLLGIGMELTAGCFTSLDTRESSLVDLVDGVALHLLFLLLIDLEFDFLFLAHGHQLLRIGMSARLLLGQDLGELLLILLHLRVDVLRQGC